MEEIDFSNCQRNARTYNGANGSKIGIYYNNENYNFDSRKQIVFIKKRSDKK